MLNIVGEIKKPKKFKQQRSQNLSNGQTARSVKEKLISQTTQKKPNVCIITTMGCRAIFAAIVFQNT